MTTIGNISYLEQPKDGFLCSRSTKSCAILPCLDWAAEHSKGRTPVMSTFHSEMEEAVLDILANGSCPIIVVLARKLYKVLPDKLKTLNEEGRLLVVSVSDQVRIDRHSASIANQYICDTASTLTFGFLSPESSLYPMCEKAREKGTQINIITENKIP